MLGRYNKTIPDNWGELVSKALLLGLQLKYYTCHSAKGLEADEVIVLDVNGGAMGFPCHLADDEFIQLLPTPSETIIDAEERRLFYVALTRSKSVVHLLVDDAKPSVFLEDFASRTEPTTKPKKSRQPAIRLEVPIDRLGRVPHCPSCNKPTFIKRLGAKGPFWGCSDFPKCWGRARKCPSCGIQSYVLDAPHGNRYCAECGASQSLET
jgi:DNA helicase-4